MSNVNTNNKVLYTMPVINDNFVCYHCSQIVKCLKLELTCEKCQNKFITKILFQNAEKYNKWTCPSCDNDFKPTKVEHKKLNELSCSGCKQSNGVCIHSELACSLSKDFMNFFNNNLYSIKGSDECSILSIYRIDKTRIDIHALKYVPLFKNQYKVSPNNVVLIRQRFKSKKNYITNIIIYNFEEKWKIVFNEKFEKGNDWFILVLEFLKTEFNHLFQK